MARPAARRVGLAAAAGLLLLAAGCAEPAAGAKGAPPHDAERRVVRDVEALGVVTFATGTTYAETEVGGLSGITYDPARDVYYALSDDRSERAPARFYTLEVDISDGVLDEGDVTFAAVTTLTDPDGAPFAEGTVDPEGIAMRSADTLLISSEGDADQGIAPFVRAFTRAGRQTGALPVPSPFLPAEDGARGVRDNLAFESLTVAPGGQQAVTAVENALVQDGPAVGLASGSAARVLHYDLTSDMPAAQHVYPVSPIPKAPMPSDAFADNGLVELLALDDEGTLLALERSFAIGVGNTIRLFETRTAGALDVASVDALAPEGDDVPQLRWPMAKRPVADLEALGIRPDNVEGMTLGPTLSDGRRLLVLVSDNNFNPLQTTQVIALALTLETVSVLRPAAETGSLVDTEVPAEGRRRGRVNDTALWGNGEQPEDSLVVAAIGRAGLVVSGLDGRPRSGYPTGGPYGRLDLRAVDAAGFGSTGVVVVADALSDTLRVLHVDPPSATLRDVTADGAPVGLFPGDDRAAAHVALHIAAAPDVPRRAAVHSGRAGAPLGPLAAQGGVAPMVLVAPARGDAMRQLELVAGPEGVLPTPIRDIQLPVRPGLSQASSISGLAVDAGAGRAYVAIDGVGVAAVDVDPQSAARAEVVLSVDEAVVPDDLGALAVDRTARGAWLWLADPADESYRLFDIDRGLRPAGRIAVGDGPAVDRPDGAAGLDVTSVALGPDYPDGVLVAVDLLDDPADVVRRDGVWLNRRTNVTLVAAPDGGFYPEGLATPEPIIYLPLARRQ